MSGFYDGNSQNRIGSIQLKTDHVTVKKPAWLVTIKLLCLIVMVAVGYVLLLPNLPLPIWQSAPIATSIIVLYVLAAFFIRPEPNTDNMGICGTMFNNPMKFSDDMNRFLWNLHCVLGPGRFVAETGIDFFTLIGLIPERDEQQIALEQMAKRQVEDDRLKAEILSRLEQRQADARHQGVQQLASASLLDPNRFDD